MQLKNFEATGLNEVEEFLIANKLVKLPAEALQGLLTTCNLSFTLEGLNRLQSTLICELRDSYVQQSQRYVTLTEGGYTMPELQTADRAEAAALINEAFALYKKMSELKSNGYKGRPKKENYLYGIPVEDARYILPLATKTNVCVAMSGDKLLDMLWLLRNEQYGQLFTECREELSRVIPAKLFELLLALPVKNAMTALKLKFYKQYFDRLSADEPVVLIDKFADVDLKAGLGALTSTMNCTPSEKLAQWGDEAAQKAAGVVRRVIGYGHTSVVEQARTTFGQMSSMVTYHQQLRHRLTANAREPLSELINNPKRPVIVPDTIKCSVFYDEYLAITEKFKAFRLKIAKSYGMDTALWFLLNCDQIKMIFSANARTDIGMMADRTCMNAQWEIRQLAVAKLKELRRLSTVMYENALPSCVNGACREGKMTCGRTAEVRAFFKKL